MCTGNPSSGGIRITENPLYRYETRSQQPAERAASARGARGTDSYRRSRRSLINRLTIDPGDDEGRPTASDPGPGLSTAIGGLASTGRSLTI